MSALLRERRAGGFSIRALPDLSAQIAHDLNNHLATMLGKAELALILDDPGRYRPSLGEILEAGQPARTLVADWQRIVSWVRAPLEPVPVGEVLGLVVRLTSRRCERLGVEICVSQGNDSSRLEDPALLTLLCWKLVRAALEQEYEEDRVWTLSSASSSGKMQVVLDAPDLTWTQDVSRVSFSARSAQESSVADLQEIADAVAEQGGKLLLESSAARVTLGA